MQITPRRGELALHISNVQVGSKNPASRQPDRAEIPPAILQQPQLGLVRALFSGELPALAALGSPQISLHPEDALGKTCKLVKKTQTRACKRLGEPLWKAQITT